MQLPDALDFLMERLPMFQRLGKAALKANLDNTYRLMDGLDNPQRKFKSIHIAGTNGKGSSAHALSSVLQAAGYKTALYTSPHLKSFTERIRINGKEIREADVAAWVSQQKELILSINPSFFEVTVAMAFDYFAKEQVDIAVIETGLGGRLDSTNVIDPELSLITMIDFDHADILGDTLEKIAGEKAGIIKPNRPVVIGACQPELLPVFRRKADLENAPLVTTENYTIDTLEEDSNGQTLSVQNAETEALFELKTDITARYFVKNLPGVLRLIEQLNLLGYDISRDHIVRGLGQIKQSTSLMGRWQLLSEEPKVVADISHNVAGIKELFHQISLTTYQDLHLIFGVVKDKAIDDILPLLPKSAHFYLTQSSVPRSLPVDELMLKMRGFDDNVNTFDNVNQALIAAKKIAAKNDLVVVFGSTFVVAEIDDL